jgi:hypothetical protein
MRTNKHIYCLEGMWNDYNLKDKSSVTPLLEFLFKSNNCNYIHHDCATKDELSFFLKKWANKALSERFPILYLACHGEQEKIFLNRKDFVTLTEIADILEDKCYGKIFYFGSCSTLKIDKRKIQSFLSRTGAIAAIGYKVDVDWMKSSACDLLVFEALQHDRLDSRGIKKIRDKIFSEYGNLPRQLNLCMVINEGLHFPRVRVKGRMRALALKKPKIKYRGVRRLEKKPTVRKRG